ncbi:MAG: flagellar assembly protein FliW [Desulfuromonas sp.]|nr:MAG: flagellar assembly protein FliW [Desulfuromonas sp.]
MRKILTRFGEVEYDPSLTIRFPEGLLGFGALHDYIVMPQLKKGPLFWIQSAEDSAVAFVLTDPTSFFPDFQVRPDRRELEALGIDQGDEWCLLAVVTVNGPEDVTLNLQAPILFAPGTNRAIQVVLDNSPYGLNTPLPKA